MLYATKSHQPYSLAIICGWDYKHPRKMSWTEEYTRFQSSRIIPVSFLLPSPPSCAAVSIFPFTVLFWKCSFRHSYLNTIKPHCFSPCTCTHTSFTKWIHCFKSIYDYRDPRKRETKMNKPRYHREQNQISRNCSECVNQHWGLSFCKRILLVLQTSD